MGIEINRLGGALGAEVVGVALSEPLDEATLGRVRQAFLDNLVLVFRDQSLTPEALQAFSRRFGPLDRHVLEGFALPDHPDVFVVSNVKEGGKPKGAIYAGQYWHSDLSYARRPVMGTMLYAERIPSVGGDTMFANMYTAYETLSEPMQAFLGGLKAVHDYAHAYATVFSRLADRPPLTPEDRAKVPPVEHPVVRTHPETGRKALYVNPGFTTRILGLTFDESRAVLDFLNDHGTRPEFVYRHKWRTGDLVFWDNRCTRHYAVPDYDMSEPRHMLRTTIAGDAPF